MKSTFNQIAIIHIPMLEEKQLDQIQVFSKNPLKIYSSIPKSNEQLISWIGDVDGLITSLRVPFDSDTISRAKKLQYIGIYGSSTALVDLVAANKNNVVVKNVEQYCDTETAQFCLDALDAFYASTGMKRKRNPTIGVIGFGNVGKELIRIAHSKGFHSIYCRKKPDNDIENQVASRVSLDELLTRADIVSLQGPRDRMILGSKEFDKMEGKVLINTSLGQVMDAGALSSWLKNDQNHLIVDSVGHRIVSDITPQQNIFHIDQPAWSTTTSRKRLFDQVLSNLREAILNLLVTW
ncbi:MAG: NAD(P)-dependent oxidoreductase [Bdellovibrionota bacterium]